MVLNLAIADNLIIFLLFLNRRIPILMRHYVKKCLPPALLQALQQYKGQQRTIEQGQEQPVLVQHLFRENIGQTPHTLAFARYNIAYYYRIFAGHFIKAQHLYRYFSAETLSAIATQSTEIVHAKLRAKSFGAQHFYLRISNIAVMPLPDKDAIVEKFTGIHGNTIRKARKNGYHVSAIAYDDHLDDIYDINRSKSQRQGRPMSQDYLEYPEKRTEPLAKAGIVYHSFGCFDGDNVLRAYLSYFRLGNILRIDRVLGHGDHLCYGIMNLLFAQSSVLLAAQYPSHYLSYLTMNNIGDFKARLGFIPYNVLLLIPSFSDRPELMRLFKEVKKAKTKDLRGDWLSRYLRKENLLSK